MSKFPSDRFAALLAHLANTEAEFEFASWLVGAEQALCSSHYQESLLKYAIYDWRMPLEEAAERYMDVVTGRDVIVGAQNPLSCVHKLFLLLCQRGADEIWSQASLARDSAPEDEMPNKTVFGDMAKVAKALAEYKSGISKNSASPKWLAQSGRLTLQAGEHAATVPEEISPQLALKAAPSRFTTQEGEQFNQLCEGFIDVLRTTNRGFQEALGMGNGLCPFDWIDELSISQVRSIRKFLKAAANNDNNWAAAWLQSKVTGFKTLADFEKSVIGRSLRTGGGYSSDVPLESLSEDDETLGCVQELGSFTAELEQKVSNALEQRVMLAIYQGDSFADIAENEEYSALFKPFNGNVAKWAEDFTARMSQ